MPDMASSLTQTLFPRPLLRKCLLRQQELLLYLIIRKDLVLWKFTQLHHGITNGSVSKRHKMVKLYKKYGVQFAKRCIAKVKSLHEGQVQICDLDKYIHVTGTTNVKKDTANSHAASRFHREAMERKNPPNVILKQFLRMDEAVHHRMCKLFDWAYTIAKRELLLLCTSR